MQVLQCSKKAAAFIATAVMFLFSALNIYALDLAAKKNVRVGYYYCQMFQEGMVDEQVKSGFSYEYLQKVADYNGWQYEYVYGDWANLLDMLQKGEIDVLAGVSKTPEREKYLLFPDSTMGMDNYYLYQHENNRLMNGRDMKSFDGRLIGGIRNNLMTEYLENWGKENNANFKIKYYDGFIARDKDFADYKLDGIVSTDNNVLPGSGLVPVVKVGEVPYYLAITNKRPDLVKDLNHSIDLIEELEPFFLQSLKQHSYGKTITSSSLSDEEVDWLKNHSQLRVGYLSNYLPFCGTDENGKPTGLMVDVFDAILNQLDVSDRVSISYKEYGSSEEMGFALHKGEIDVLFPVGGGTWFVEQNSIDVTSPVVTAGMDLVYKDAYSLQTVARIGVNKNNLLQYYFTRYLYPSAEIIFFQSSAECLKAVENEVVNSTLINGLRIDQVLKNDSYKNLHVLQLERTTDLQMGVESGNYPLLLLLNRGLTIIGRDFGINASFNYVNQLYKYSVFDFLREYSFEILIVSVLVLGIIIFLLVVIIIRRDKEVKEKEKYLCEIKNARQESTTDELTGFLNRRAYAKDIKLLDSSGLSENFTVISLDINGLKNINDTLGHTAGDELISGACQAISEGFSQKGKIYRTGGDEFIVTTEMNKDELSLAILRFRNFASGWKGSIVKEVSLSMGYASRRDFPVSTLEELLKIADQKMYEDKSLYYTSRRDRRTSDQSAYNYLLNDYIKVLKVDLGTDSYQIIKMDEQEKEKDMGFSISLFAWMKNVAECGLIAEEDKERYLEKLSAEALKDHFMNSRKVYSLDYSRKYRKEMQKVTLEMVPSEDFALSNQVLYLYVRKVNS